MNFQQLRSVREAVRRGFNLTEVAAALHTSQPGVSRQIRELEAHLGAQLFTRVGRAVELTVAGSIFFDAVQLSFVNISQAAERIRSKAAALCAESYGNYPALQALLATLTEGSKVDFDTANRIDSLHFAAKTPYETMLQYNASMGERVMRPEVARALKKTLGQVAELGVLHLHAGGLEAGLQLLAQRHRHRVHAAAQRGLAGRQASTASLSFSGSSTLLSVPKRASQVATAPP